uniref:Uncharacterized protein n=1 Tax=Oryza rufipogon TaxID=4529 RepID=A0A0E0PPF0_ORYRU
MAGLVVRRGQGPSAAWRRGEGPLLVAGGGGDVDRAGDDGGGEGDGQVTKSTMDGVRRLKMAKRLGEEEKGHPWSLEGEEMSIALEMMEAEREMDKRRSRRWMGSGA